VGAGSTFRPGAWVVGTVTDGSAGVQGLEPIPDGGEIGGPGPAGRNLQDFSSGVGDQAGWGRQQMNRNVLVEALASCPSSARWRSHAVSEGGSAARRHYGRNRSGASSGLRRPSSCLTRSCTWAWVRWRASSQGICPVGVLGANAPYSQSGVVAELGGFTGRLVDPAGEDPQVAQPGGQSVVAGCAQDPGQLGDLGPGFSGPVGVKRLAPVALTQHPDRGQGPFLNRPADRVLHPAAVRCGDVAPGEVVDDLVAGAGTVDGD